MAITAFLKRLPPAALTMVGFMLVFLVGIVDFLTGKELSFSIFYLPPIFLVAWFAGLRAGVVMSLFSAVAWHTADFMTGHIHSHPAIPYWNTGVRLGFFLMGAVILSRLKTSYEDRQTLIQKLQGALAELRAVQEEVEKKALELARSNAELERFAYVAAHDLKSPLLVVEGYINRLRRTQRDRPDDAAEEYIRHAIDGISRMRSFINDLLEYSRAGAKTGEFTPVDCNEIVDSAVKNLRMEIEAAGAVVTHDPMPTVAADGGQLVQLFQNLIGNAIKFRREGEPPRVHVSAEVRAGEWLFSVQDNGIGIAPEDAARIFEIFQRIHGGGRYPGTGIGLAICKKVVESHGGRIWVESGPGRGSAFFFTLPARAGRGQRESGKNSLPP